MGVSQSREGDSSKSNYKLFDKNMESVLVDLQERVFEQYPELKESKQSCTVTDNSFPDNPIIWVNDEFERMTLYPKEEIIGKNCRFLQGPKTNPLTVQNVKKSIVLGEQIEVEILNYRKDGVAFWNRFLVYPVYERNGTKATHFIAVQKDITFAKSGDTIGLEWSVCEVSVWLEQIGLEEYSEAFREAQIDGSELLDIKQSTLKDTIGMSSKAIEKFMQEREDLKGKSSIFGDSDSRASISSGDSQISVSSQNFLRNRSKERIAIKCYLDSDNIRIYAVKRKARLSKFCRMVKKSFNQRFEVILIGGEKACNEDEWNQAMNEAKEETVRVYLSPTTKRTVSTRLFNRSKIPSIISGQDTEVHQMNIEQQRKIDLLFIQSLQNGRKLEKAIDFSRVLHDESEFLNLVNQSRFSSNMQFPSLIFDFFNTHECSNILFKWILKRELKTYPSPNSFFREATLTTNIFSVLFQNEMTRYFLQNTLGNTVRKIISHGKLEIELGRTKIDSVESSIKWISNEVMVFFENMEKYLAFCPLPIREAFDSLLSMLKERPQGMESIEMVSSIFFLRFISPVFLDPMRFGILPSGTKLEDSQFRSLVLFSKTLQWIANNSSIDSTKSYSTSLQNLVKIGNPMIKKLMSKLLDQKDLKHSQIMHKCSFFVTQVAKSGSLLALQKLIL